MYSPPRSRSPSRSRGIAPIPVRVRAFMSPVISTTMPFMLDTLKHRLESARASHSAPLRHSRLRRVRMDGRRRRGRQGGRPRLSVVPRAGANRSRRMALGCGRITRASGRLRPAGRTEGRTRAGGATQCSSAQRDRAKGRPRALARALNQRPGAEAPMVELVSSGTRLALLTVRAVIAAGSVPPRIPQDPHTHRPRRRPADCP